MFVIVCPGHPSYLAVALFYALVCAGTMAEQDVLQIDNDISFDELFERCIANRAKLRETRTEKQHVSESEVENPRPVFAIPVRPPPHKRIAPLGPATENSANKQNPVPRRDNRTVESQQNAAGKTASPSLASTSEPVKASVTTSTPVSFGSVPPAQGNVNREAPPLFKKTWKDSSRNKSTLIFSPNLPPPPSLNSVLAAKPSDKGAWRQDVPNLQENVKEVEAYGLKLSVPLKTINGKRSKERTWKCWHPYGYGKITLHFDRRGRLAGKKLDFTKQPDPSLN